MKYITTAISMSLTALPCTAADIFLKNGDKVVMMGDSITEHHLYSSYGNIAGTSRSQTYGRLQRTYGEDARAFRRHPESTDQSRLQGQNHISDKKSKSYKQQK
ncbi:MAG: hypothetical protein K9N23_00645 [Akkermansiaceae bacterium]|nr:hypothetical protein [Akkermansiaceae bacterium]